MEKKVHLFICCKCAIPDDFEAGTVKYCGECGGEFIDTGKSYEEWESILEQQPDAPPKLPDSDYFDEFDVIDFVKKQVIDPLGTFDQKEQDKRYLRHAVSTGLHCPRCFSTNIDTCGGYEYGSNGVGASGYGWDSGDGLVATGYRNVCKNCGYKWQR